MTYDVEFSSRARRDLVKLPLKVADAVIAFAEGPLRDAPRRVGKPLHDPYEGLWSARRGTYRLIYAIDDAVRIVEVVHIGHRADVYRP